MRVLVRILTALLGIALAVAGGLLAVEVGWAWWRPGRGELLVPWPDWRDRLAEISWQSQSVRITAAVVVVVGLALVLFAATARRTDVALTDPAEQVSVRTSPRSLARIVGVRVRSEPDVSSASVTATARHVRVRATSGLRSEEDLLPRLLDVVRETLTGLPLAHQPKVSVVVDSRKDRE